MAEEEIDKHVLRKYEVLQKLGKGVSLFGWLLASLPPFSLRPSRRVRARPMVHTALAVGNR
jgi:hypothetical protein